MTLEETNEKLKLAAASAKQRAVEIVNKGDITNKLSQKIWDTAIRGSWYLNLGQFIDQYADSNPSEFDTFVRKEIREVLKEVLTKNGFVFNTEYSSIVWNHLLPK